jgi:hypothetical protein
MEAKECAFCSDGGMQFSFGIQDGVIGCSREIFFGANRELRMAFISESCQRFFALSARTAQNPSGRPESSAICTDHAAIPSNRKLLCYNKAKQQEMQFCEVYSDQSLAADRVLLVRPLEFPLNLGNGHFDGLGLAQNPTMILHPMTLAQTAEACLNQVEARSTKWDVTTSFTHRHEALYACTVVRLSC